MRKKTDIILFDKLNRFINKYYKNKILKGIIFLSSSLLVFLLFFSLIEHFSRLSTSFRQFFFWGYILINLIVLIRFIIIPFFHLFRIGKVMNYTESAKIIGNHFEEIDDQLINVLQLNQLSQKDKGLIGASIEQKTHNIRSFSFSSIIKFKDNRKHLKWILIPVFIFLFFFLSGNRHIITESSARIIDYKNEYIPEAPFQFHVSNSSLTVVQYEDFQVGLSITGKSIPSKAYIEIDGNKFSLSKNDISNYDYLFKNVVSDIKFRFFAEGYYSEFYTLSSLLSPRVLGFQINLTYPKYTNIQNNQLENIGDLVLPEGTQIQWAFNLKNTNYLQFDFNNQIEDLKVKNGLLTINKVGWHQGKYSISTYNENVSSEKTYYTIEIIKDEHPKIKLESSLDSLNNTLFFNGTISDDYSLSKLMFHYSVKNQDREINHSEKINIHNLSNENFYHYLNLDSLLLAPSEEVIYYFEVWDNDNINGYKSTKSRISSYKKPSKEELEKRKNKIGEKIKNEFDEAISLSKKIQEEISILKKSLIDKKNLGWKEKKKAENIIKNQKKLEEIIKENNARNNLNNQSQEKLNSSILEKQKKLEDLMNKVLDEESKKLMEQLQKLIDEMDKEKMKEVLDKMEKDNSNLEKDLDRNLEIYKDLEFQQKLEETIEKIDELKKQQEALKQETEEKKSESEKLSKEQENLQEILQKLEDDLKKLEEKNDNLENKKEIPNMENEKKETSLSMEESKKSLDKKQKNKSSKKQQKAIENLEKMSQKMQGLQSSCSSDRPIENMETLRQILENLITLSFDQEELIDNISSLPKSSNSIIKYIQIQKKLLDDSQIIEDSLFALSKRVVEIEPIINKEIRSINYNIDKSISLLENRKISKGASSQQYAMTSMNNLALLLSETLRMMQMEFANENPGNQQCNKPGNSAKPSLKELKKMQNNLMKKMKGKEGEEGKKKGNKCSEQESLELMKLANQQQQIRLQLQEIRDDIGKNGEKGNIDRILEKMEENEFDIINNNIHKQTLLRQEEILTRLLEAEESQRERGEDEKRESIEWRYEIKNNSDNYLEYMKNKKQQEELLKTTPIQLNEFYKQKVNRYFNTISNKDQ